MEDWGKDFLIDRIFRGKRVEDIRFVDVVGGGLQSKQFRCLTDSKEEGQLVCILGSSNDNRRFSFPFLCICSPNFFCFCLVQIFYES